MALWENATESLGTSWTSNVIIGAAAVLLAPIVAPAVLAGMRPLSKVAIKGGVLVYDKARELIAETSEQLSDLVAEARAELAATAAAAATAHSASAPSQEPTGETEPTPSQAVVGETEPTPSQETMGETEPTPSQETMGETETEA
jgi:hypothetical protein